MISSIFETGGLEGRHCGLAPQTVSIPDQDACH